MHCISYFSYSKFLSSDCAEWGKVQKTVSATGLLSFPLKGEL